MAIAKLVHPCTSCAATKGSSLLNKPPKRKRQCLMHGLIFRWQIGCCSRLFRYRVTLIQPLSKIDQAASLTAERS